MIPIFQNEARKNLTGNARELWIAGIENFKQQKVNLLTIKNKLGFCFNLEIHFDIFFVISGNFRHQNRVFRTISLKIELIKV